MKKILIAALLACSVCAFADEPAPDAGAKVVRRIRPHTVMLYPIDRETPARKLVKVGPEVLNPIAEKVRALGITAKVY